MNASQRVTPRSRRGDFVNLKYYRVYFLTSHDQIFRFIELDCKDDATAKEEAARLLGSDTIEVWHQGRKVCRLEPSGVQRVTTDMRTG